MLYKDLVNKYKLENKATSNIKIHQVLSSLSLNAITIFLRDGPFSGDIGIVNLHPSKGTHWVCYINGNSVDSYDCSPPNKLSRFLKKRNGYCLYSEYQIQKHDSFCASYCLYLIYLTKIIGIDFRHVVLNLYYQMI